MIRINKYEIIDPNTLLNKKHFDLFNTYDDPTYSLNVTVDITAFYHYVKANNLPMYVSLIYLINNSLNKIKEFRYRYIDGELRLYEYVDPAFTIMTDVGAYDNCDDVLIHQDFKTFVKEATRDIDALRDGSGLSRPQQDTRIDQIYYSSIPWISYNAVTQVMHNNKFAYIPRIVWDKFKITDDKVTTNLTMQVHHAIIDAYPLSKAYLQVQEDLNKPEISLQ